MLFQDYHIPMIRSGSKTVTRREWDQRKAKPGNVYIASTELFVSDEEADCYIRATDVYQQPLGEITDADARDEGDYDDLAEFREGYERVYEEGAWDPEKEVWVVEFEYVGEERPPDGEDPTHYEVRNRDDDPVSPTFETQIAAYDWIADNLAHSQDEHSLARVPPTETRTDGGNALSGVEALDEGTILVLWGGVSVGLTALWALVWVVMSA